MRETDTIEQYGIEPLASPRITSHTQLHFADRELRKLDRAIKEQMAAAAAAAAEMRYRAEQEYSIPERPPISTLDLQTAMNREFKCEDDLPPVSTRALNQRQAVVEFLPPSERSSVVRPEFPVLFTAASLEPHSLPRLRSLPRRLSSLSNPRPQIDSPVTAEPTDIVRRRRACPRVREQFFAKAIRHDEALGPPSSTRISPEGPVPVERCCLETGTEAIESAGPGGDIQEPIHPDNSSIHPTCTKRLRFLYSAYWKKGRPSLHRFR